MTETLLHKSYNWEDSFDISRDVEEAVNSVLDLYGDEFGGNLKVVVTYEPTVHEQE